MTGKVRKVVSLSAWLRCYAIVILLCHLPHAVVRADNMSNEYSGISLSVGETSRCVEYKRRIKLTCSLQASNVNKYNLSGLNLKWHTGSSSNFIGRHSIEILRNNTTIASTIIVYVNWTRNEVFTCFSAVKSGLVLNASVTLTTMPPQTQIEGLRYIEQKDAKVIELYWKQNMEFNYNYTLRYEISTDDNDDYYDHANRGSIDDSECMLLGRDIYQVPNTKGHTCKAVIHDDELFQLYKVHLETSQGKCRTSGPVQEFKLEHYGENTGVTKVVIPYPVENMTVSVAMRRVELAWSKPSHSVIQQRWYRVMYNCSELKQQFKTVKEQTNLTLYDRDFHPYVPYANCQFCIQVHLEQSNNVFSEPLCRKARLHEEVPSEPPTITCTDDECATAKEGRFRNITVTWSLPPRKTRNGVLTQVAMIYKSLAEAKYSRVMESNLTQGFTVLAKLEQNTTYMVKMAACNSQGCSQESNSSVVHSGKQVQNQPTKLSNNVATSSTVFVIIIISVIVIIIARIFVGIVVYVLQKRTRQRQENQLPDVNESFDIYEVVSSVRVNSTEYDELNVDGLIRHGESNMSAASSEEFQESETSNQLHAWTLSWS